MTALWTPTDLPFPDCIMATISQKLITLDGVKNIEYRALSVDDPAMTAAIDAIEWNPGDEEIAGHPVGLMPSMADHIIRIQHNVKHSSTEQGAQIHRSTAREIRTMLYADADLAVSLRQLSRTAGGVTERMLKFKPTGQQLASNRISGAFVSVSVTDYQFTTEMVPG